MSIKSHFLEGLELKDSAFAGNLASMNDTGKDFNYIANIIEEYMLKKEQEQ